LTPRWICRYCGFTDGLWSRYYWRCPYCGKPLDIEYRFEYVKGSGRGLQRFSKMLPFTPEKTRGEGSTPLITESFNGNTVLFKLEYLNPSGSFKDRGSALAVYYGYKMGFKEIVEDTSGNTGISVTLYSRLYGLKPLIVMPKTSPRGKRELVKALGGVVVEASDRSEASRIVLNLVENKYYVAHTWNYMYIIGASTIVYEVYEEYGVPDIVIAPIGSGGLILGLYHGFEKLMEAGLIDRIPVFIGVQGCSVQPVYRELYGFYECGVSNLADGIMVENPPRLESIVSYIKRYNGRVMLVDNKDVVEAMRELYDYGFIVEPTSATVWAVYKRIKDEVKNKTILLPLTGSGLKTLGAHEP